MNHSLLSDPRLGGVEYRTVERCRNELVGWRVYYLDPRGAMRSAKPPAELSFTWDEAAALYLGRRLLEPLMGTIFWQAARAAFKKIQAVLEPAPRAYLVVPMVGAFFIDFTNAIIITAFLNLWR